MWTHEITALYPEENFRVDVTYSKAGSKSIIISYHPQSLENLKQAISFKLQDLSNKDILATQISLGVLDLTPVDSSTQEDKDREIFRTNYDQYFKLKKAIDAGLGKPDKTYTDLETVIKTTYKDEYASIIKEYGN